MKLKAVASALTAVAVAVLASTALAQTNMKISISIAQNSHQGVGIDTFAKEVEKRSNGRIKIQPFYSGSLGGERESIEAVQRHARTDVHFDWPDPEFCARGAHSRHPVFVSR